MRAMAHSRADETHGRMSPRTRRTAVTIGAALAVIGLARHLPPYPRLPRQDGWRVRWWALRPSLVDLTRQTRQARERLAWQRAIAADAPSAPSAGDRPDRGPGVAGGRRPIGP